MTGPQDVSGTLTSALTAYTDAQAAAVSVANDLAAEVQVPMTGEDLDAVSDE